MEWNIFFADLFELIGSLTIAYTVIAVHHRIVHDKKIDKPVIAMMKHEQVLTAISMTLLVIGFFLRYLI